MDFVVGIEIHLSGNHTLNGKPFHDICDELAGKYPKDFKFTGWHPQCRCFVTTILKTKEEREEDVKKILRGEPVDGERNVRLHKLAVNLRAIMENEPQRILEVIPRLGLSEDEVRDIIDGKNVVAPIRQIQEVKNAIKTYELYPMLDAFKEKDLLKAHGVMMQALVDKAGHYRQGGVGVFGEKGLVHLAPPAARVPMLMGDLFFLIG